MSHYSTRSSDFTPTLSSSSSHQSRPMPLQDEQRQQPQPPQPRNRRSITKAEQQHILQHLLQKTSSHALSSSGSQPASDSSDSSSSSFDIRHITASTPPPTRSRSTINTIRFASQLAERQQQEQLRASASSSSSASSTDSVSLSIAQRRERDLARLAKLTQPRSTITPPPSSRSRPPLLADASWDMEEPSPTSPARRIAFSAAQTSSTPSRKKLASAPLTPPSILKRPASLVRPEQLPAQQDDDSSSVRSSGSGLEDLEAEYEALRLRLEEAKRRFSRWHVAASIKVRMQEEEEKARKLQVTDKGKARMLDEEPEKTPIVTGHRPTAEVREAVEQEQATTERVDGTKEELDIIFRHGEPLDDITEEQEEDEQLDKESVDTDDESGDRSQVADVKPDLSAEVKHHGADGSQGELVGNPVEESNATGPQKVEGEPETTLSEFKKPDLDKRSHRLPKHSKLMFGSTLLLLLALWICAHLAALLPRTGDSGWPASMQRSPDDTMPVASSPASLDRYQARHEYSLGEQRWMMEYYDPMYPELYPAPERDDGGHARREWRSLGHLASMVGLRGGGKDLS
ncbi:hypothetical protein OC846_006143 [Tilletia horrida]|uniref:Transmembrane protein n=1 Tax=Tilletia horrida TaxID=155126 RepID=A0AAN6JVB3_9BASI|nr:hypothetical protein OC846_006143 [Tilletia horrida]KAK0553948.1 hypothetical protein OC845_000937 [Tilletia horrida]KAK0565332.1 hypothetical protein OC861_003806 [Tilletia horrida]